MDAWTLQNEDPRPVPSKRPRRQNNDSKERQRRDRQLQALADEHGILADERETCFRHGHWQNRRRKITAHLRTTGISERALFRWENCGGGCTVWFSPSEKRHIVRGSYCHSRHCEPCMRAKANRIAAKLKARLRARPAGRYRFVTLTLKHNTAPLADQIRRLFASFKKLRSKPAWKKAVRGGLFTLEVKHWPAGSTEPASGRKRLADEWHPHIHAIVESDWLSQQLLRESWLLITGDSSIVDIRLLQNGDDAAHYVTKYVTKSCPPQVWDHTDAAQEWITASKGTRTANTFGSWRGMKLTEHAQLPDDLVRVATLREVLAAADRAQPWATAVLLSLRPPGTADAPPRGPPNPDRVHSNDGRW